MFLRAPKRKLNDPSPNPEKKVKLSAEALLPSREERELAIARRRSMKSTAKDEGVPVFVKGVPLYGNDAKKERERLQAEREAKEKADKERKRKEALEAIEADIQQEFESVKKTLKSVDNKTGGDKGLEGMLSFVMEKVCEEKKEADDKKEDNHEFWKWENKSNVQSFYSCLLILFTSISWRILPTAIFCFRLTIFCFCFSL